MSWFGDEVSGKHCDHCASMFSREQKAVRQSKRLKEMLLKAIDLAEEGWSYADDYYKVKWKYSERLSALKDKP